MKSNDLRELSLDEIDAVSGGMTNFETKVWGLVFNGMITGIIENQPAGQGCANVSTGVPTPCVRDPWIH